ncbi:MAG: UDP-glucose/GDP-mannose dehydrogenase family protein [Acidobacteria bacterium]|nr:UDP-glucose/GDP-mannose dehydrogenase family protein [Acidobacteriota bacterium]
MNIAVIGTGYVGLVTGACFAEFGVRVTCVDREADKIARLKKGEIPIYEPGLEEIVRRNMKSERLTFTTDLKEAVTRSLVVFIAVGTPQSETGEADLSYVRTVAEEIGRSLDGYKVVVTKSTVPMGTGRMIREVIHQVSGGGTHFSVASNPEFLREGSAVEDFLHPNRVVIGTDDAQAAAILKDLYSPLFLIETPFIETAVISAEMIKYAANAFLAVKISYINEVADLCDAVGADVHDVARGMGLDRRIGMKFLHPGPGYGGSCFPKDTQAAMAVARASGREFKIVEAAEQVNKARPGQIVARLEERFGPMAQRTVAVLGLTFKPNTDDLRESPAIKIIQHLKKKGAAIRAYDPVGMPGVTAMNLDIITCEDEYDAARGADLLILATEWNQFRNMDMKRLKEAMNQANLADLRNIYDPEEMRGLGFEYMGVGR